MGKPLLAVCSIPKIANRDGRTGANAKLLIPTLGYVMSSGGTLSFPGGTIAQDQSTTLVGTDIPGDSFHKDCCSCDKG